MKIGDIGNLVLAQDDTPSVAVDCSPWKDADGQPLTLFVRVDAAAMDEWDADNMAVDDDGKRKMSLHNMTARLLVKVVCDGDGHRVFSDAQVVALGKKNPAVCKRLYRAAMELAGRMGEDGSQKKSSPDPNASSTASPSPSAALASSA